MPLAVGQALAMALELGREDAEEEGEAVVLALVEAQDDMDTVPEGLPEELLQGLAVADEAVEPVRPGVREVLGVVLELPVLHSVALGSAVREPLREADWQGVEDRVAVEQRLLVPVMAVEPERCEEGDMLDVVLWLLLRHAEVLAHAVRVPLRELVWHGEGESVVVEQGLGEPLRLGVLVAQAQGVTLGEAEEAGLRLAPALGAAQGEGEAE